jgi:transposase
VLKAQIKRRPAMKKVSLVAANASRNFSQQKLTVGLDLGDRNSWYCVLDETGQVQLEQRVRTTAKGLREVFGGMPRRRIALKMGTHSPWISRLLSEFGHEVIVANARKVRLIGESRSAQAQTDLMMLRAPAGLVRTRTGLVNTARGLGKSYGERLRGCNVRNMNPEKAESLSPELQAALEPLLAAIESVSERIAEYNERIEKLAQESYPQVALLKQIKGVGTLIALTCSRGKIRIAFARAATWAAIWDCSRDAGNRDRVSRSCISAKKAIPICARCWCKERSTSWIRSGSTAIAALGTKAG